MQNRRIVDRLLNQAGKAQPRYWNQLDPHPDLHVKTGKWACVLPEKLVEVFGFGGGLRAIPIVEPEEVHKVGLSKFAYLGAALAD